MRSRVRFILARALYRCALARDGDIVGMAFGAGSAGERHRLWMVGPERHAEKYAHFFVRIPLQAIEIDDVHDFGSIRSKIIVI
jgi:hypothetical protein